VVAGGCKLQVAGCKFPHLTNARSRRKRNHRQSIIATWSVSDLCSRQRQGRAGRAVCSTRKARRSRGSPEAAPAWLCIEGKGVRGRFRDYQQVTPLGSRGRGAVPYLSIGDPRWGPGVAGRFRELSTGDPAGVRGSEAVPWTIDRWPRWGPGIGGRSSTISRACTLF